MIHAKPGPVGGSPRSRAHRRARARIAVLVVALALCAGAAAFVAGCSRKTNLVVIPPDSTHTGGADSLTESIHQTQEEWENGGSLEAAAASTAKLIALRLRNAPSASWHEHTGELLDSLNIGAEIADTPCAMVTNLFPRSDPEAGSWPYVFWCTPTQSPAYQALEGKNLHLQSAIARGLHEGGMAPDSVRLLAASFTRRTPGGLQPLVMTWNLPRPGSTHWTLVQTLGADSLGFGSAEFEVPADSVQLAARTYRQPRGFVECATCPHVYTMNRFDWTPQGFVRAESKRVPSPYAAFADFIGALVAGDQARAADHVADPGLVAQAEQLEWNVPKGAWRPAPGSDESPIDMTFFRGPKDAFAVHFRAQNGDWVITGFEPAKRTVE